MPEDAPPDKPDAPKPKARLRDIAVAAGVAQGTVSNVFNHPERVSDAIRARVMEAAEALGYQGADPLARMLRTGRIGTIAVMIPEGLGYAFGDPAALALIQGVAAVCDETGRGISVYAAADVEAARKALGSAAVDGFIMYCMEEEPGVLDIIRSRGLPVVTVDQPLVQGCRTVTVADRTGAAAAARHLLDLGHRRIGVLSMELMPDSREGEVSLPRIRESIYAACQQRLYGYLDVLAGAGIPAGEVAIEECLFEAESIERSMPRLMRRQPGMTAILATCDRLALWAMAWLARQGLSVPGDVSVIGFDDIAAAATSQPPLTTIRQPLVEKGRAAAELLIDPRGRDEIHFGTELVLRGSTGPARG
jgi:DNA-binding LacI/PurR family transcriptional regulator